MKADQKSDRDSIEPADHTVDELIEAWEQGDLTLPDGELVVDGDNDVVSFVFEGCDGELNVPYVLASSAYRSDTNEEVDLSPSPAQ